MNNNHNQNRSEWERVQERIAEHFDITKKDFVIVNMPECMRDTKDGGWIKFELSDVEPGVHLRLSGNMCSIYHQQWHNGDVAFSVESYELDDYLGGWDIHVIKSERATYVCLESHREMTRIRDDCTNEPEREKEEELELELER